MVTNENACQNPCHGTRWKLSWVVSAASSILHVAAMIEDIALSQAAAASGRVPRLRKCVGPMQGLLARISSMHAVRTARPETASTP